MTATGWAKDAGKKAWPFVVTGLVAVVFAVVAADLINGEGGSGPQSFEPPIPPVEFLYLDGGRILEYLSALEGGEVGPIKRVSKEINSVKAGIAEGPLEVGASAQRESSAESTLTQNESSALSLLLARLEDSEEEDEGDLIYSPEKLKLVKRSDLEELWEGKLVKFVTHHLLSPGYIRPYVVVRQSATLAALFPRSLGDEAGAAESEAERERAEAFVQRVGPDPRLTFAVAPPPEGGESLRVLLPMRYSGLTQERSLLEKGRDEYTGGRLVIVGKVIRLFEEETKLSCGAKRFCEKAVPEYTDWATREIWTNPLQQASDYLIDHVSRSCETPGAEGRECFIEKLQRQTELYAPGVVILPLAIYK